LSTSPAAISVAPVALDLSATSIASDTEMSNPHDALIRLTGIRKVSLAGPQASGAEVG